MAFERLSIIDGDWGYLGKGTFVESFRLQLLDEVPVVMVEKTSTKSISGNQSTHQHPDAPFPRKFMGGPFHL